MRTFVIQIVLSVIILLSLLSSLNAKGSKKKDLDHLRKINRPNNVSDELYCYSCIIPTKSIIKRIKPSYKDLEILDVVTDSCKQQKGFFNRFNEKFKASLLKDACEAFITNWEDLLVKNTKKLHKNSKVDELVDKFCIEIAQACKKSDSGLDDAKIDYDFVNKRIEDL